MATFYKKKLSASTDGRPIAVAATSSPGTTIHTGSSTSSVIQEVWLYASNYGASSASVTLQWGGTSASDNFTTPIPSNSGLQTLAAGLVIQGNTTPLVIRAYSPSSSVTVTGFVNEIA